MIWTDEQNKKWTSFEELKYGDGFEKDDFLYIKIKFDEAFDIINNRHCVFNDDDKVLPRDCEIIFH